MRTVIVVPCYNEAQRLDTEEIRRFVARHDDIEFLFVDDGSRDETAALLQSLAASNPQRLHALILEQNQGKAEAVRRGIQAAVILEPANVPPDFIGFWDADLATPLPAIVDFVNVLATDPGMAMVLGARVKLLGRAVVRKTSRHYLGRIFATVAAKLLGLEIYDTQCGAKLFRSTPEFRSVWQEPFLSKWIFDVEILARFLQHRQAPRAIPLSKSIYEFPLMRWEDVPGSKLRSHHFLIAVGDLWKLYNHYLKHLRTPATSA